MGGAAVTGLVLLASPACASTPSADDAGVCRSSQLRAALGAEVSEATGQRTLVLTLTNTGRRCVLHGYPALSFYDASGRIPFRVHHGGDQMITGRRPQPVSLGDGTSAVVMVNKYRCDLGDRRIPSQLRLGLAGERAALVVSLVQTTRDMSWCGSGDPGSTVDVTPFEPSVRAARS
jgi:hypothetical protein